MVFTHQVSRLLTVADLIGMLQKLPIDGEISFSAGDGKASLNYTERDTNQFMRGTAPNTYIHQIVEFSEVSK